ncbi:MAG: hypothetical protein RLZZ519_816 [Bacteroidota bacterium]|jgi:hypothetical protein
MAKATTPHPIQGKIGNLIYTVRNGKQFVHEAPKEYVFRQGTPAHGLNRREFAGAAKIACEIYNALKPEKPRKWQASNPADAPGPIFKAYSQNHLTGLLKKASEAESKRKHKFYHFADRFLFRDAAKALTGLDLSRETAQASHVKMIATGPQHNPTAIRILGLAKAAEKIRVHGNARLEFRFHIRQTSFVERFYSESHSAWVTRPELEGQPPKTNESKRKSTEPSGWIPVDIIPNEGFSLDLPTWEPDATYFTAILIEWREVRNVGNKTVRHHSQGIVRIVCAHAPAEAWEEKDLSQPFEHKTTKHHAAPMGILKRTARPRFNPRIDPKAYIAAALAKMRQT